VYFPHAQWDGLGGAEMSLVARTTVDPASVAKAIESAVHAVDPAQPLFGVQTMEQVVAGSIADRRLYLWLLGGFAAVALLLAVAGVYGVVSYTVAQRTPEFGIRMALGADAGRVSRLVVWQGARLTLLGLAIGVPAAFVLMRLLAGLLYGVGAADPATYAAVALVLAAAALVASYVPARRATRVHPAIALRAE
jgi:ABC-type antimicrobial peptide transport system permease subunit